MDDARRGFMKVALTAAAAVTQTANAQGQSSGHGQTLPSDTALRVKSLESLLVEKGLVDRKAVDALIDTYEHKIGPRDDARTVARPDLVLIRVDEGINGLAIDQSLFDEQRFERFDTQCRIRRERLTVPAALALRVGGLRYRRGGRQRHLHEAAPCVVHPTLPRNFPPPQFLPPLPQRN